MLCSENFTNGNAPVAGGHGSLAGLSGTNFITSIWLHLQPALLKGWEATEEEGWRQKETPHPCPSLPGPGKRCGSGVSDTPPKLKILTKYVKQI